ncbi:hypothetical protein [Halalkalibaculum roseum]|nr:hypothetical protein [Halalkalibaculum roseum]
MGLMFISACSSSDTENENENDNENVVEVTATHNAEENQHLFEMGTHELTPGWTTFEFSNASPYDHFFLIWKVPQEGIEAGGEGEALVDHWHKTITEPFQNAFDPYIEGEIEFEEFTKNLIGAVSESAPWFLDPGAQTLGGPGFTAAGRTSETTVNLGPGHYIVECYVKNEEEVFHSSIGMLTYFDVAGEDSTATEPEPSSQVAISSTEGIQFDDSVSAGDHTFEIIFEDQATYSHLQGHNVQLVRLADKEDQELLNELAVWLDWRQPGSLVNRAPEGATLMGGSMEMAGGSTAYFHTELEPGDYAWIAEVPNPSDKNMLQTFTVSGSGDDM